MKVKVKNGSSKGPRAKESMRIDWHLAGRWLFGLAMLSLLGAGGLWTAVKLQDPYVMPLQLIRIDGSLRHLRKEAVEAAVGRVIQGNFFTVDVARVQAAAVDLGWVEAVSVRRVWPGTLLLEVKEQVPLARWGAQQLVNRNGAVFTPKPDEIPGGLPGLSGPEGASPAVVARYLYLRPRFLKVGLELEQVHMDARQSWRISFVNGLALQLGSQDTGRRLDRFLRIYPRLEEVSDRRLASVDLRYTNGFSALWEPADSTSDGAEEVAVVVRERS